jgi:hypothetical protein
MTPAGRDRHLPQHPLDLGSQEEVFPPGFVVTQMIGERGGLVGGQVPIEVCLDAVFHPFVGSG